MTTIFTRGPQQPDKKEKSIVFQSFLVLGHEPTNGRLAEAMKSPKEYANIEIICEDYEHGGKSLMFAYDTDRANGHLYIGYANDKFVE